MADAFGDRMKLYEAAEAGRRFMPLLPIVARLDGRCFSAFTRGLARPYDERLSLLMIETTRFLVEETEARCGYTQSDEITLAWYSDTFKSQVFFDGRVQKMVSVLAGTCASAFNRALAEVIPEKASQLAVFDCRMWTVPTLDEAANQFLWREHDATKNSISMAAHSQFSDRALYGKTSKERQEMLFSQGINWNDYPGFFKHGVWVVRRKVTRPFSAEEIGRLPPKHDARLNPNLVIERTEYVAVEEPRLSQMRNRVGFLFRGESPEIEST